MIGLLVCQPDSEGTMRILIAGAGIGGLTAGIALKQAGFNVRLFEQSAHQREAGAGLWLWQNAMRALDSIGVGDAVRDAGVRNAHGGVRTWRGDVLVERVPANPAYESVALLRADLQAALSNALDSDDIQYGASAVEFEQDSNGVTLRLASGEEICGDILIGADGIYSTIGTQLFGPRQLRYAGFTAWRGVTRLPHSRIPTGVLWGNGARFGFMPVRDGQVNWFAGRRIAANSPDAGRKEELLRMYQGWAEPIEVAIAGTDEAAILRHDIYTAPPLSIWSRGRVTLLGDAAHSMTPSIGQGACQAIEDAVVLADKLRGNANPAEALQDYETTRKQRAYAVAHYSGFMDWLSLWSAPLSLVRNTMIRLAPPALRDRQLEWIINPSR